MSYRRYPTDQIVTSTQNGFDDVLDWLGFLCSKEYLHDVLVKEHQLPSADAASRADQIVPYVRIASGFILQSLEGPADLSFLPAYYAMLNLSKVYVLLGPRHQDLQTNRYHGASYDVNQNNRSVLTEAIILHTGGVFPLFYETLTGQPRIAQKINLPVSTILPCMQGIAYEYDLATGTQNQICVLHWGQATSPQGNRLMARVRAAADGQPVTLGSQISVPALPSFVVSPLDASVLVGDVVTPQLNVRSLLKNHLLFRRKEPENARPLGGKDLTSATLLGPTLIEFPEEIPIWLLFFYLSSIVRYKPEFVERLKDSKYWPVISTARLHVFLDFLLAFWSFVHQKNYFVISPQ